MNTLTILLTDPVSVLELSAAIMTFAYLVVGVRLQRSVAAPAVSRPVGSQVSALTAGSNFSSVSESSERLIQPVGELVRAMRKSAFPVFPNVGVPLRSCAKRSLARQFS